MKNTADVSEYTLGEVRNAADGTAHSASVSGK